MLVYLHLFGSGANCSFGLDVSLEETLGTLQARIHTLHPEVTIRRCIFAGRQLDDESKTLDFYSIHKECVIQVFTGSLSSEADDAEEQKEDAGEEEKSQQGSDESKADVSVRSPPSAVDGWVTVNRSDAAPSPSTDSLPPLSTRPLFLRQCTNPSLQFGDILIVQLLSARNLPAVDWGGSSDPYVLLTLGSQSARSSVVKKSLNPVWNQTFIFWVDLSPNGVVGGVPPHQEQWAGKTWEEAKEAVGGVGVAPPAAPTRSQSEGSSKLSLFRKWKNKFKRVSSSSSSSSSSPSPPSSSRHLTLFLYDHDWVRSDESLGFIEVDLNLIPRDHYLEQGYTLMGARNGEVTVAMQRGAVTSPELQRVVWDLVRMGRPLTHQDMMERGVSLKQLLGKEPFVTLKEPDGRMSPNSPTPASLVARSISRMPALVHLAQLLSSPPPPSRLPLSSNSRSLHKLLRILLAHRVVDTVDDLPSNVLWLMHLQASGLDATELFLFLRKRFPNRIKRVILPPAQKGDSLIVWWRRTEDALLALLTLCDLPPPLRTAFGVPFSPHKGQLLFDALKASILQIAGPFDGAADPAASLHGGAAMVSTDASASEELPPGPPSTSLTHGVSRTISLSGPAPPMGRINSGYGNDAPHQKGKVVLKWVSRWTFLSPPSSAHPTARFHALTALSDFNLSTPEQTQWFINAPLGPLSIEVERVGPWSIKIIHSDTKKAVAEKKGQEMGEEEERKEEGEEKEEGQKDEQVERIYYLRSASAPLIDEWFHLLKSWSSGEEHPQESQESPVHASSSSGSVSSRADSALPSVSESGPLRSDSLDGSLTSQVYCNSCHSIKDVLDIYTVDSALDAMAVQQEPVPDMVPLPAPNTGSSRSKSISSTTSASTPVTQFSIAACRDCLLASIRSSLSSGQLSAISSRFSLRDLSDLLPRSEFDSYVESSTLSLLDAHPHRFVRCPSCTTPIEVDHHSWATKNEHVLKDMQGLDRRPLSEAQEAFFLANRFMCRACKTDFCKQCKAHPFHPGYSCEEYVEYQHSPKCRYCGLVVTARTRLRNPPSAAFHDVCHEEECAAKVEQACTQVKPCGHPCPGVRGEQECPPCLHPDCPAREAAGVSETLEDYCSICYSEELGQSPVLRLGCGHWQHFSCTNSRIDAKWATARISFEFIRCPLCNDRITHPLLEELLRSYYHLEARVRVMSVQRLKFEELDQHVDIISPQGRFYQDREGFAMDHYMFYQCFECQDPYFAGARACGAAGQDDNIVRAELLCGGCQRLPNAEECKEHGSNFMIWKCRFCCTFSTYFCFGKTHFCDACHSGDVWPKLVSSSGVNQKPYNEYPQCAGIKERVEEVMGDSSLTEQQKENKLAALRCDPEQCPLNLKHPPSGFEFGLGCGMCKPSSSSNVSEDVLRLQKAEEERMREFLQDAKKDVRRWNVPEEGVIRSVSEFKGQAKVELLTQEDEESDEKEEELPTLANYLQSKQAAAAAASSSSAASSSPGSSSPSASAPLPYDTLIHHYAHSAGDDLHVQSIDAAGYPVEPSRTLPLHPPPLSGARWVHVSAKRGISFGCQFFQFQLGQMPLNVPMGLLSQEHAASWAPVQMVLGVVEEDLEVAATSVVPPSASPSSCPLPLFRSGLVGFTDTGCHIEQDFGTLRPTHGDTPLQWRAGDLVGILIDLDHPKGIRISQFHNGFEIKQLEYKQLKFKAKRPQLKLVASFRMAGAASYMLSLLESNYLDRAIYRFDAPNTLPLEQRLPRGVRVATPMRHQNESMNRIKWVKNGTRRKEEEEERKDRDKLEEIEEEEEEEEEEEAEREAEAVKASSSSSPSAPSPSIPALLAALHAPPPPDPSLEWGTDPARMRLHPFSPYLRLQDNEISCPGRKGAAEVMLTIATDPLPLWGEDKHLQYMEMFIKGIPRGSSLALGFCRRDYPRERMPGWDSPSCAVHGDDGKRFDALQRPCLLGAPYCPIWHSGDVVGIGLNRRTKEVFYTLNGKSLGVAFSECQALVEPDSPFRLCIALTQGSQRVGLNFKGPFHWRDMDRYVREARWEERRAMIQNRERGEPMQARLAELEVAIRRADERLAGWQGGEPAAELQGRQGVLQAIRANRRVSRSVSSESSDSDASADEAEEAAAAAAALARVEQQQQEEVEEPMHFVERFPPGEWSCEACTLINKEYALACEVCQTPRVGGVSPLLADQPAAPPLPAPVPVAASSPPPPPIAAASSSSSPVPLAPPMGDDHLNALPLSLLRSLSGSGSGSEEEESEPEWRKKLRLAKEAQALAAQERIRQEQEDELKNEFDGTNPLELALELQGSAALQFHVPLASAPHARFGMEQLSQQAKKELQVYTLVVDMLLPSDQLDSCPSSRGSLSPFPLFDTTDFDDHLSQSLSRPFFWVHPSGKVCLRREAQSAEPVLRGGHWSRVVVTVDNLRRAWQLFVDGQEVPQVRQQVGGGVALNRLNLRNASPTSTLKQLSLFFGQTDMRTHDAQLLKRKRVRQVTLYNRCLSPYDIWAISGGAKDVPAEAPVPRWPTHNPFGPTFCTPQLRCLPMPLRNAPAHRAVIRMAHPLAACDLRGGKAYILGGMDASDVPTDSVYEVEWRKRPLQMQRMEGVQLPDPRSHAAAVWYEGSVYLFGGRTSSSFSSLSNSLFRFTPSTLTWHRFDYPKTVVPPMAGHAAVVIGNHMYVVGGSMSEAQPTATLQKGEHNHKERMTVWQYAFQTNQWKKVEIMSRKQAKEREEGKKGDNNGPSSSSAVSPSHQDGHRRRGSRNGSRRGSRNNSRSNSRSNSRKNSLTSSPAVSAAAAASSSFSSPSSPSARPFRPVPNVWCPIVGCYDHTLVVFGGSSHPRGQQKKYTGKGVAAEIVLVESTLHSEQPQAVWRNLLNPAALGRARGPAEAIRLFGGGGMVRVGEELLFYGGHGPSSSDSSRAYAYHPRTHTWRALPLTPPQNMQPMKRADHTTAFDPHTGQFMAIGGGTNGVEYKIDVIAFKDMQP